MKQLTKVVSRKGQVTVPVEIRRQLGIKEGDRVTFVVEGEEIRLKRGDSVVQRTAGAFKDYGPRLTAEELREVAEEAFVEDATRSGDG
jgi:AbrB family looped-hinge helix DNA binding protein